MFGPDVSASVTTGELRQLVEGVRFIEDMRAYPVDKDASASALAPTRAIFTKSVVARVGLPRGIVLEKEHLALKKPGTGIPPARASELIGKRTRRALAADEPIHESDLEAMR
jgi:N-acetylneuraminate synthase